MNLSARLIHYLEPLFLLSISILQLPATFLAHPFLLIASPSEFRSKWFEKLWMVIGPKMAASPLQIDDIEYLMSRAHGTVLEFGPGTGEQMYHFKADKIDRIYGAEPNPFMHPRLLSKANAAGVKYTALTAGAQPGSLLPALKQAGLLPASASTLPADGLFDSIISIKCLCSVPQRDLPATVAVAQALLKPGGEFIFFEHLGNTTDIVSRTYAWFVDLIWPICMGGCRLDGKLDAVVNGMGGWEVKDVKNIGEFQGFEVIRYVNGVCRKPS